MMRQTGAQCSKKGLISFFTVIMGEAFSLLEINLNIKFEVLLFWTRNATPLHNFAQLILIQYWSNFLRREISKQLIVYQCLLNAILLSIRPYIAYKGVHVITSCIISTVSGRQLQQVDNLPSPFDQVISLSACASCNYKLFMHKRCV